jgi:hypothetical protein
VVIERTTHGHQPPVVLVVPRCMDTRLSECHAADRPGAKFLLPSIVARSDLFAGVGLRDVPKVGSIVYLTQAPPALESSH